MLYARVQKWIYTLYMTTNLASVLAKLFIVGSIIKPLWFATLKTSCLLSMWRCVMLLLKFRRTAVLQVLYLEIERQRKKETERVQSRNDRYEKESWVLLENKEI